MSSRAQTLDWLNARIDELEAEAEALETSRSSMVSARDLTIQQQATRIERLNEFAAKVDAIRNDIIGRQRIGWSAHIYPLVAALGEVGLEGAGHEAARESAKRHDEYIGALEAVSARARTFVYAGTDREMLLRLLEEAIDKLRGIDAKETP